MLMNSDSNALLSPGTERRSNFSTLRPNRRKGGFPQLSVSDVVGNTGHQFGMKYYNPPSNEMHLKRTLNGATSKKKLCTFAEEI